MGVGKTLAKCNERQGLHSARDGTEVRVPPADCTEHRPFGRHCILALSDSRMHAGSSIKQDCAVSNPANWGK